MMDKPPLGRIAVQAAAPHGVLQRAQHQLDIGSVAGLPADNPPRERIPHTGQPQRPLPGSDARDIGDPQPVGCWGGEVAVDRIRRRRRPRVLVGRAAPALAQERALQAGLAHQPRHPLARGPEAVMPPTIQPLLICWTL
jgi:hypothetical protein